MAGNLIGEPFKSYVNNQILARQKVHGKSSNRTLDEIAYLNSRNAWIKMASGVKLKKEKYNDVTEDLNLPPLDANDKDNDGGKLAQKFVLFNGLGQEGNRAGIGTNFNENSAYGIGGTEYGYSPMPGIIDASLKCINRGSIKKVNINLVAHNAAQFNVIDALYLRLGYSVFIEWGYDKYIDNNNELVAMGPSLIDEYFFDTAYNQTDYSQWIPEIEKRRRSTDGNYEGIFGTISNFSWTFEEDGSYKIKLEIISLGDVVESLKTNLPPLGVVENKFTLIRRSQNQQKFATNPANLDQFYNELYPELKKQLDKYYYDMIQNTLPVAEGGKDLPLPFNWGPNNGRITYGYKQRNGVSTLSPQASILYQNDRASGKWAIQVGTSNGVIDLDSKPVYEKLPGPVRFLTDRNGNIDATTFGDGRYPQDYYIKPPYTTNFPKRINQTKFLTSYSDENLQANGNLLPFSQHFDLNAFVQPDPDENSIIQNNIKQAITYAIVEAFIPETIQSSKTSYVKTTPKGLEKKYDTDGNEIGYNRYEYQNAIVLNYTALYGARYANGNVNPSTAKTVGLWDSRSQTPEEGKAYFLRNIGSTSGGNPNPNSIDALLFYRGVNQTTNFSGNYTKKDVLAKLIEIMPFQGSGDPTKYNFLKGVYFYFLSQNLAGGSEDTILNPPIEEESEAKKKYETTVKNRITNWFGSIRNNGLTYGYGLKGAGAKKIITATLCDKAIEVGHTIYPFTSEQQTTWNTDVGFPKFSQLGQKDFIAMHTTDAKFSYFVRFRTFLQFLQEKIIPKIESTNKPMITIDLSRSKNICFCPDNVISSNLKKLLVRNDSFYNGAPLATNKFDEIFPQLERFKISSGDLMWGRIMNIYFNFDRIEQIMSSIDENGSVSLYKVLKTLCSDINESLGNVNNIEPVIEEGNKIKFIDQTAIPKIEEIGEKIGLTMKGRNVELEVFGYNQKSNNPNSYTSNFVHKVGITTEINKKYATMITIGATANGSIPGVEATAFSQWNNGIIDRFKNNLTDATNPSSNNSDPLQNLKKQNESVITTYRNFLKERELKINLGKAPDADYYNSYNVIDDSISANQSTISNFYKYAFAKVSLETTSPYSSVGFMPFNLKLDMDGIGGIKIYNKVLVNTEFLPAKYGKNLEFIITGVNHKISNNNWTTHLDTIATSKETLVKPSNYKTRKILSDPVPTVVNLSAPDIPIVTTLPARAVDLTPTLKVAAKKKIVYLNPNSPLFPIKGVFQYRGKFYAEPKPGYAVGETYEKDGKTKTRGRNWFYRNLKYTADVCESFEIEYPGSVYPDNNIMKFKMLNLSGFPGSVPESISGTGNRDYAWTMERSIDLTLSRLDIGIGWRRGKSRFNPIPYIDGGKGAFRDIGGAPGNLSGHAFALALDICSSTFRQGARYASLWEELCGKHDPNMKKNPNFKEDIHGGVNYSYNTLIKFSRRTDGGSRYTPLQLWLDSKDLTWRTKKITELTTLNTKNAFDRGLTATDKTKTVGELWNDKYANKAITRGGQPYLDANGNKIKLTDNVMFQALIIYIWANSISTEGYFLWDWGLNFGTPDVHHFTQTGLKM